MQRSKLEYETIARVSHSDDLIIWTLKLIFLSLFFGSYTIYNTDTDSALLLIKSNGKSLDI